MKKNRQKPAAAGFNPLLWVGKKLRKTSYSISYEYDTVTNAFAVEVLRSSVVSGNPETYSVTLLIYMYHFIGNS